ncbi:ABC transporter substrate-binding protein [Mesorhizobium ciceri]|uniref:ABC transporter substrate-binding protein n=1 Tax=Mesorhizobium TaxID=68287 RepID=UPI00047A1EAF|nr:ABC transporter substrate-binding protein [Mesorhizobium ciceri]
MDLMTRIIVAGVFACGLTGYASAQETINIGVVQPQAGECAQWGVPITRGVQIWAEEFNANGGIADATGKKHQIKVTTYDNNCYTAGDELTAFRRAILDDKVNFILQTFTPASRQAVAQIATENKVLTTSYGAGYLNAKYPFLIGSVTGSPGSYMFLVSHLLETRPDIKKVAIVTADHSFGQAALAYYKAGITPYAKRVEIVYSQPYDPASTSDMLGLATPIFASSPDLIVELGFTPGQQALFIEAMEQLGYKGLYGSEGWTMGLVTERIPAAQLAGRVFSAYVVDASEPSFSPRVSKFYKSYVEKYGQKEWSVLASVAYAAMTTVEAGIQKAAAPTGDAVRQALFTTDTVDQPLFGKSHWGGAEMYGANNWLLTPLPVYVTDDKGGVKVDAVVDVAKWWNANKDAALPVLAQGGQVSANK